MKKVLIVTYDLVNPGQNYEALLKKIKGYPTWARLGGSSYLIYTDSPATEVRNNLKVGLDTNDKLYVGVMSAPAAWAGLPEKVSAWIRDKLA